MYLNVKFVENLLNSRKTIMQIHVVKNAVIYMQNNRGIKQI
jgi:hypothetical protein